MVIFRTKLEVDHNNADLTAGHNQNDKNEKQKAKQVVELILIHRREYEKKFNEAGAKGENS